MLWPMMWRSGPQVSLILFLRQHVAGALDVRPVAHLEGDVMDRGLVVAQEIHGVMVAAAAQEGEEIAAPVRDTEAEHVAIEFHHALHVGAGDRRCGRTSSA